MSYKDVLNSRSSFAFDCGKWDVKDYWVNVDVNFTHVSNVTNLRVKSNLSITDPMRASWGISYINIMTDLCPLNCTVCYTNMTCIICTTPLNYSNKTLHFEGFYLFNG